MKVIFVASGNKKGAGQVNSFVQSQYDSLKAEGLDMVLFPVVGHGAMAHLKAAWQLRKLVRREKPDVIHAHYSIYGYVAVIACMGIWHKPKIVVSILGSFPRRNKKWKLVRFCVQHVWDKTLVKSERTKRQLGLDVPVIPNGVNLEVFQVKSKDDSRKSIGFEDGKRYVVWCSNPDRPEKDFKLAQAAVDLLKEENNENKIENNNDSLTKKEESQVTYSNSTSLDPQPAQKQAFGQPDAQSCSDTDKSYLLDSSEKNNQKNVSLSKKVELIAVYNKTPQEVCTYMNAADCLLLTSVSEGSPNVIKEAMACNCPIVTTNVGDVTERLENLEGCYVVDSRVPKELAEAIRKALEFGKRTEGRERIIADQLKISQVAKRIAAIYNMITKKQK